MCATAWPEELGGAATTRPPDSVRCASATRTAGETGVRCFPSGKMLKTTGWPGSAGALGMATNAASHHRAAIGQRPRRRRMSGRRLVDDRLTHDPRNDAKSWQSFSFALVTAREDSRQNGGRGSTGSARSTDRMRGHTRRGPRLCSGHCNGSPRRHAGAAAPCLPRFLSCELIG